MTWSSIFTKEDERQTYLLCQLHYWHSQVTVEKNCGHRKKCTGINERDKNYNNKFD